MLARLAISGMRKPAECSMCQGPELPTHIFEWAFDKGRNGSPDALLQYGWVGNQCNNVSHRATFLVLSEAWRFYHGPLCKSTLLLSCLHGRASLIAMPFFFLFQKSVLALQVTLICA